MDLCGLRLYKPWLIPLSICLIYPFLVISNATHFMCAVIWVCWLSFLDSSSFSYRILVIGLLCRSMYSVSSVPWLWCCIVMDSFIWLFDVAACVLWYPDFNPCFVALFWSVADSVVLGVYVSACGLLDGVPNVTTLEVHAVSLINSWCTWNSLHCDPHLDSQIPVFWVFCGDY